MKRHMRSNNKGVGLIIVILVMAFLLAVGILLLYITGTGPKVAGNIRWQQGAFNAAEAGFDQSWQLIEAYFVGAGWTDFDGHYLESPAGIDLPLNQNYFRKHTDEEVINFIDANKDGISDYTNVISFKNPFVVSAGGTSDPRYTFTSFLINDEAGAVVQGGTSDPFDAILVCVGVVQIGNTVVATSRIEIELAIQNPGT